jgi:hypothetical protein
MNSTFTAIYGYITQVWMIRVAKGKCGWWTSGGQQSITFQKIWIFQVKLQLKYTRWFKYDRDLCGLFTHKSVPVIFEPPCITSEWYSKDTGEVIPVHNKVSCYEEVWESGTVGRGLHSLSIWWRLSGQSHIMDTSLPGRPPLPSKIHLIGC